VRWRVPLSCVLILGLALSPARASLQGDYLNIYLKLNDSERLEHNGDYRGALEGFEDCYAKLRRIHVNDPDWEPVLVTSRMGDCFAKIKELEPKVAALPVPPINPEPSVSPEAPAPKTGDMAAMQERLLELEQELSATKKELADTTQKYHDSQIEVQTLHTQLDGVNQQLAALKSSQSVDQNMGDLMARNKDLTDRLAAAQSEIKAFTANPHSATSKLAEQLKLVREKLDASEAANAGLTETTTTLQQQLNQAQHDLAVANNQLATTGPGSPQYLALKHENELMRGILLREIQEQSRRDGAKRLAQEEFDRLKITSRVLQEQLDILGSPMTPPNNDEERELLASIKVAPSEVTPMVDVTENGNHLAATANGAPVSEGNPPGTAAPSNDVAATNAAPSDTNAAPPVAADTNTAPATTNSETASTTGGTNASPATNAVPDTNAAPSVAADTNAAPAAPDTNAPSVATTTNATPGPGASDTNNAPGTASPPSSTNAAPSVASDTNAAPAATNTPSVAADTNAAPAASTNVAPVTTTDTNTPPTVTSTHTATASSGKSDSDQQHRADVTRYGNQPRLPDDMREIAQEATVLFENKHYDEAAAKYQTIIDKYPESLYAWSNLGVVRSQQGKQQEALKALQQAVKLSPNDAFSYRNLGIVYFQLGQNDAAIDALERSIALEPNNVYSHDYLGCACSQKGWEEVAEKEFLKAVDIDPDFPDAHYNLAIVYAIQKPPALALARREYKRALDLSLPRDPRLEKLLGL
jgi:Flp pilus assembly protein TadD